MKITVIRSNRKTMCMSFRGEELVVKVPNGVNDEKAMEFVQRHRRWIGRQLEKKQTTPHISLTDGSELVLFERRYAVATGKTAHFSGDKIFLPQENREEALIRALKRLSQTELGALTERIAKQYGFRYSCVTISSARGRWGSCNAKGRIMYSFRTAFLPKRLVFYVAVHELCHTRQLNHGQAFWAEVEKILPDPKTYRKELKNMSQIMEIL